MSSVFKGLNRSDVYLTDYNSRKKWVVTGNNLAELGIKVMIALSGSCPYYSKDEDWVPYHAFSGSVGVEGTYNQKLLYRSIYELYYSGSIGDGTFTGSKDYTLQTDLTLTGSRVIPESTFRGASTNCCLPKHQQDNTPAGIIVISLPKDVFGTNITPGSFKVDFDEDVWCYVEDDYISHETGSFCDEGYPLGTWTRKSDHWVDPYFEDLHLKGTYDFEGLMLADGFTGEWHQPDEYDYPTPKIYTKQVVGDIIYTHGQVILTNEFIKFLMENWDVESYEWESNKPIFTKHVTCKVRDIDFNRTYNKTATEELQNTPGFTPYVSAVGLYNTYGDLIAVAKLSKPIKKALDTEMTFDLQIDLD